MNIESSRVYQAIVWLGSSPGKRVEVVASNLERAETQLKEVYGAEAVISLWNEEDANSPKHSPDEDT